MKKLFCLLLFSVSLSAAWETKVDGVSNFLFGSKLRRIFGKVWNGARLEVSNSFVEEGNLYYWVGADFLQVQGNLVGLKKDTSLTLVPLGGGVKLKRQLGERAEWVVGAGPRMANLSVSNHLLQEKTSHRKIGWGGILFTGFDVKVYKNVLFDVTSDVWFTTFPSTGLSGPVRNLNLTIGAYDVAAGIKMTF